MITIEDVRDDIRAFADDEKDVIVEQNEILFKRFGREIHGKLKKIGMEDFINLEGTVLPYSVFISKHLARLDIFAQKIIERHKGVDTFINGPAILEESPHLTTEKYAFDLLEKIILEPLPFSTRVAFITADAGQGKTVLLRKMQYEYAKKYLDNQSHFLFWHVDLQGRQLLRLREALAGDLDDLRVVGLYMQSIIRLIRYGFIVLAIDGFDELAAEQGSTDALGALGHLVKTLNNSGTIIAASRRAFFDAEEYIKRTIILNRYVSTASQFDQLRLTGWTEKENIKYLTDIIIDKKKFDHPENIYNKILHELKDPHHPMLTKPFLFTQLVRGLLLYGVSPAEFLKKSDNALESVASILNSFIDREVTRKWKARETGEPYLTHEQHTILLSHIAEEMWISQLEKIRFEMIEEILSILMDEWNVAHNLRKQIADMVKAHVLLIPTDGDYEYRKFEHPEFKNYFLSHPLREIISDLGSDKAKDKHLRFLSIAQLPDSVAKYAVSTMEKEPSFVINILKCFEDMIEKEWRPTYLQSNIGTIIPYLISGVPFDSVAIFSAKAVYSSLVFEHTVIRNLTIKKGQFVKASFADVKWENIIFEECEFHDLKVDNQSKITGVMFKNCNFDSISICIKNDEEIREYSPQRIVNELCRLGFTFFDVDPEQTDAFDNSYEKKILIKFLNIFKRRTYITQNLLKEKFHHQDWKFIFDKLIVLAIKYNIIEEIPYIARGNDRIWQRKMGLEDIYKGQDIDDNSKIGKFWREIRSLSESH